jgi:hypothetical protein
MTTVDIELLDGEQLLSDSDELIYRQIAPHMLMDGVQIATTAFGPNSSDEGMPSYSRSTLVSAQDARDWHTRNAPSPSLGVWGVTVEEVVIAGRYVVDDSATPLPPGGLRAPGHCFVDFRRLARAERKSLRARLYMHAMARGEISTEGDVPSDQLF